MEQRDGARGWRSCPSSRKAYVCLQEAFLSMPTPAAHRSEYVPWSMIRLQTQSSERTGEGLKRSQPGSKEIFCLP